MSMIEFRKRIYHIVFGVLCLVQVSVYQGRAFGQNAAKAVSLTISLLSNSTGSQKPLQVKIEVKNTTNKQILLKESHGSESSEINNSIVLIAPDGQPTRKLHPANQDPKAIFRTRSMGSRFKRLDPGDVLTEVVNISDIFDLSKAGAYKLRISRKLEPEDGGGIAISNEIILNITQLNNE